jgi:hypothetical protein
MLGPMRSVVVPLPALVVLLGVVVTAARSSADEPGPVEKPLPKDVVMHVDQSRMERKGREVFVRIDNGTDRSLTVEALRLTSPRLYDIRWKGCEVVGATYQGDVEIDLPKGRCGTDVGATTVDGEGAASVLRLPVTLAPTGKSSGVRFAGFESTDLFRQTVDSPADVSVPLDAGDPVTTQVLSVVPTPVRPARTRRGQGGHPVRRARAGRRAGRRRGGGRRGVTHHHDRWRCRHALPSLA